MKVRYPTFDFSELRAHWAREPEFAQSYNAFSTVPAHVEPFLVKVMTKAKKALNAKQHSQLIKDIDVFNKQEIQHCKMHLAFNQKVYALGYEDMAVVEQPYKEAYERFISTKSLRFNVAYCEGFEALGSASALVYFEDMRDYLEGADQQAMDLWSWHLAEEFEHRSVCLDVYHALYGKGVFSYFYRVWAFLYAVTHIGRHVARVEKFLIEKDQQEMTANELKASKLRFKRLKRRNAMASLKRLVAVLSPWYDPAKKVAPSAMGAILETYPDVRES